MKKIIEMTASAPKKLDAFLHQEAGLTSRQIRQVKFREDGLSVNGTRAFTSCLLAPGDRVRICLEDDTLTSSQLLPCELPITILYEDEDLLALQKEAGSVVHPSPGHYTDSLANRVSSYYNKQGIPIRVRPIGRLDRDTSGIVLFAKNQAAASRLSRQREQQEMEKEYLAITSLPPVSCERILTMPLERDPQALSKMRVSETGKAAWTSYQLLECFERDGQTLSLLRCQIHTGRMHQIRVHLSSIGAPLLGDPIYGVQPSAVSGGLIGRTALHAWRLRLTQPFTGRPLTLTCPLPEDMEAMLPQPMQECIRRQEIPHLPLRAPRT